MKRWNDALLARLQLAELGGDHVRALLVLRRATRPLRRQL
jgi:hypothetical protein